MPIRLTGKVVDENRSGVGRVLVSNGEDIVKTDSSGNYTLEADPTVHSFALLTVFLMLP